MIGCANANASWHWGVTLRGTTRAGNMCKEATVRNTAQALSEDSGWWRRAEEETHHALTEAAHELSDEAARTIEYLALLCGALARDAGLDEDNVAALATSVRERVKYDHGIITGHMAPLMRAGYHGAGAAPDA